MAIDSAAAENIVETVGKAGACAAEVLKYIYAACGEFYTIKIRDIFSAALTDITDPSRVRALGIIPDRMTQSIFADDNLAELAGLISYALAVRIPFIVKQATGSEDAKLSRGIYDKAVASRTAVNVGSAVTEDFRDNLRLAKSVKYPPAPDNKWFSRYIYNYRTELAHISNRNLYFSGCADALITLYYDSLVRLLTDRYGG